MEIEKLYSVADTAKILNLKVNTLRVQKCQGRNILEPVIIGNRINYRESDILALINQKPKAKLSIEPITQ